VRDQFSQLLARSGLRVFFCQRFALRGDCRTSAAHHKVLEAYEGISEALFWLRSTAGDQMFSPSCPQA
jgi:hypothetical protein